MSTDIEDNDLYTFEFTRIITEIENEITINDPTDDDTEDEFEDEIDEESESEADESENETTNSKNKKKRGKETNSNRAKKKKVSQSSNLLDLPPPLSFQKFQHTKPYHTSQIKLSNKLTIKVTPHLIFHLFFTDLQLNTIVENTNYYAVAKSAGKGREWVSLTVEELLIWLALLIYMGIFKLPSKED
ncbi:1489_t:CDS:1 [Cetraspora pellucida]|uniref:1489_t:CDS:1 n=1 Tax=Cetraspora pellucida TaxID=1433469 RepID=A0ACA9NE32_9GLOM|nr:1489_t:CDS:1 [Cetraspora pellucida]